MLWRIEYTISGREPETLVIDRPDHFMKEHVIYGALNLIALQNGIRIEDLYINSIRNENQPICCEERQRKDEKGKWHTVYTVYNRDRILEGLAYDLAAKYIGKAQRIRSIRRRQNYNGTQTYTVYYEDGRRCIYTVDLY